MKLTFLGTRGYIDAKSRRHRMHTSLMVAYRGREVMIDCGETWLGHVHDVSPRSIVITHAHADHVGGLANGCDCPVYATEQAWEGMGAFPLRERRTMPLRKPRKIEGITFEAFGVEHSLRAPAVGYRISAGRVSIFYVPDVVYIYERETALAGVRLYIGDGATLTRSLVRRRDDRLIGHTTVPTQLTWCQKEGVPRAIITHCGSEIVTGDERSLSAKLAAMARQRGIKAELAHDGMDLILR